MAQIPVVAFSAYSGTGKTTLIEKLVLHLKTRGLRVAVLKHDGHDFEMDQEGKDSWRFAKAGADVTLICSDTKTAMIQQRKRTLQQNLALIQDVDLILVEGYKQEPLPRIGLCRRDAGGGLPAPVEDYIAVATDDDTLQMDAPVPRFDLNDICGLAEFICERFQIRTMDVCGVAADHKGI